MSIISVTTSQAGLTRVLPSLAYIQTTDSVATVTATGYLNKIVSEGTQFSLPCLAIVSTQESSSAQPIAAPYQVMHSGTDWSLVDEAGGGVILPSRQYAVPYFTNTTGTIDSSNITAANTGPVQFGSSGSGSALILYPSTSARGTLVISPANNAADYSVSIANASFGQSSTLTIPDVGNFAGNFMMGAGATPFVSGNFPVASGTAGLFVDSGKSAAALPTFTSPTIANRIATWTNTSGNLGENAATAINGGNIQAGLSGTAGALLAFPATAARGHLVFSATENTGNTTTSITNAAMGQTSQITIPDPGAGGSANFVLDHGVTTMYSASQIILGKANGTEAANAVTASGNAGVITTSALTTAGGANYAITWTNTKISSSSVILLTIMGGTNTTENITLKALAGSGTSTLTIYNNTAATALNGTILIGYAVL